MKKLVLGLLLTVGISGVSFANDYKGNKGNNENKITESKELLNNKEGFNKKDEDVLSCYHEYKTRIKQCDGTYDVMNFGGNEGDCGDNENGSLIIHVFTMYVECDNYIYN
jgi:hypothetical protein